VDTSVPFFNPRRDIAITRNRLPHWSQDDATYFLTFRLADALPESLLRPWREDRDRWRISHPLPWSAEEEAAYHRLFSAKIDGWLDAGHGSCLLRRQACAQAVIETLQHDELRRVEHHAIAVMPNHVHALFSLISATALPALVRTWKGVSARRLNALAQRSGPLWQKDYFDRLIRDEEHFRRCLRYIRNNPAKANLREGDYLLHESEFARTIE
jgi:REP element-mobilizing transposase RayT